MILQQNHYYPDDNNELNQLIINDQVNLNNVDSLPQNIKNLAKEFVQKNQIFDIDLSWPIREGIDTWIHGSYFAIHSDYQRLALDIIK